MGVPFRELGLWPRWIYCPWCGTTKRVQTARDELVFWRVHAPCMPTPVVEALEVGWGQEGVHAGGADEYMEVDPPPVARRLETPRVDVSGLEGPPCSC